MEELADEHLARRAAAGDGSAFESLVRRHARTARRVAFRLCGNLADADEILQESFLQLHRRLDTFQGEARFSTWFYRVVVNAALMHLRARKRREPLEPAPDEGTPAFDGAGTLLRLDLDYGRPARADEMVERRELARFALEALDELPEGYRMPFVLRDLEELSTAETAEILELELDTVRKRLQRARFMLRSRLERLMGEKP